MLDRFLLWLRIAPVRLRDSSSSIGEVRTLRDLSPEHIFQSGAVIETVEGARYLPNAFEKDEEQFFETIERVFYGTSKTNSA